MDFWWYIGIGAGAVGAGFLVFKIIPAITRAIQYRRYLKQLRQKDFEKNLERIQKQNKELQLKRTKRQERKLAKAQTMANLKNLIAEAKQKMTENGKRTGDKLKKTAIAAGKKGIELAGKAKDKSVELWANTKDKGLELGKKAKDKASEMIEAAKQQQKFQVIKTPQEHLPAPSPAQDQYEMAILAKEEEILRLQNKGHLSKQEAATLKQYEREVLNYRMINPKPAEPIVIEKEEKKEKQPMTLATPQPEYDLDVMEGKMDRLEELSNQENLTKEEIQEMKTLKKETDKFFSGNPDYQFAYLNRKIHEKQAQENLETEKQRPSEIEKEKDQQLDEALEAFENQNPTLGKRLKNYLQKNKNKNN